jgi:chromosome segregation ATPase
MVRQQLSEQLSETLSRLQENIDDQITAEVESATEFQRDENMALRESLASLQQEAAQLRATVEHAQRAEHFASEKVESLSAVSLATEAKLRKELASALALANAALQEGETPGNDDDEEREKDSAAALRLELKAVEEQASTLSAELELLSTDNMELQSTVAALTATVAVESEATETARAELEAARQTIEKQRARISSLRKQLALATSASDESTSTSRRRNSDSGATANQNATPRARTVDAPHRYNPRMRASSVSPPRAQVDGDYRRGGVSWGRGPGATFGTASTGRSGTPELGKGHRRPAAQDDVSTESGTRQSRGVDSTTRGGMSERRKQRLVSSAEQAVGSGGRGRRGDRNRRSLSPEPSVTVSSSPASAIALSGLLEDRDRLRNVLAIARDAHADEVARLKSAVATARASAEQWQQACTVVRSQLATAEAELKQRRRKAAREAKSKREAAEQFKAERFEANRELRNQLQASGQGWSDGAGANTSSTMRTM